LKLFKDIFRKVEAFDFKFEALINVTRLFEHIFNEIEALIKWCEIFFKESEAFIKITRLLKDIFREMEVFV
jgi:hypothetical protein